MNQKLSKVSNAREFFSEELKSVFQKRGLSSEKGSFEYLVDLLLRCVDAHNYFVKTENGKLDNPLLAQLYGEYLSSSPEVQKVILQKMGDFCMMVSGFFADSLNRKLIDVDYYAGMGGAAYWQLAQGKKALGTGMFQELSVKFKPFSNALGEMSERSGLQNNSDLLRVYEKWIYTGSGRLKELLAEKGIVQPIETDLKKKH